VICTQYSLNAGIGLNVLSIALVGLTAMLVDSSTSGDTRHTAGSSKALVGVILILIGALTQSFQYVFEEKVMTGSGSIENSSVKIPPLLLVRLYLPYCAITLQMMMWSIGGCIEHILIHTVCFLSLDRNRGVLGVPDLPVRVVSPSILLSGQRPR